MASKPYTGPKGYDTNFPPRFKWQKDVKLGGNLRYLRQWYRLTAEELSEVSEIPRSTILAIEDNTALYPNLFTAIQLARIFDVTVDDLVFKNLSKRGVYTTCSEAMDKYFYG